LAADGKSFFAFERPNDAAKVTLSNNILLYNDRRFALNGRGIDTAFSFKQIPAFQEFWHSWRSFHPNTKQY
jgi:hypothetical protein